MSAIIFNIGDLVEITNPDGDNPERRGIIMKIDTTGDVVLYDIMLRNGRLLWYAGSQLKGCGVNELAVPEPLAELRRLREQVAAWEAALQQISTMDRALPCEYSVVAIRRIAADALAGKS